MKLGKLLAMAALGVSGAMPAVPLRSACAQAIDTTSTAGLVKAASDAVDKAEFNPSKDQRTELYRQAVAYAQAAIKKDSTDADGHFELARAIGRQAQTMGARDRVKYAGVVHDEALKALALNPKHAGAMHVLGVWNAEVMRLSGFTRLVAKNLLGGKVFNEASWDNAQKYLEDAVALEPNRITHHLDLGGVYADRKNTAKAREEFEWIANAPIVEYNDRNYKDEAARQLKELK